MSDEDEALQGMSDEDKALQLQMSAISAKMQSKEEVARLEVTPGAISKPPIVPPLVYPVDRMWINSALGLANTILSKKRKRFSQNPINTLRSIRIYPMQ